MCSHDKAEVIVDPIRFGHAPFDYDSSFFARVQLLWNAHVEWISVANAVFKCPSSEGLVVAGCVEKNVMPMK